jgi:hypothetical protein
MVMKRSQEVFEQIPPIVMQTIEATQQFAPKPPDLPIDPNQMAEIERRGADDVKKDETRRLELDGKKEIEFSKLSAKEREQAVEAAQDEARMATERAARLEELLLQEKGEDERIAAKLTSDERRNTQDNLTALEITAAELEAGNKSNLSTGTGINP